MQSCYNLILVLQNLFYVFLAVKFHHQEVSCRMQALWYNVLSKYKWYYGESSMCVYSILYTMHIYDSP